MTRPRRARKDEDSADSGGVAVAAAAKRVVKKGAADSKLAALQALAGKVKGTSLLVDEDLDRGFIDTGNLALNFIISGRWFDGGIPMGRITEIYGPSSAAKTALATQMMASCQRMGGIAVLIDSERAFNTKFAQKLGLDPAGLLYTTPETLEGCFDYIVALVKRIQAAPEFKDDPILIVYDSIAASPSKKEYDETVEQGKDNVSEMGNRAKVSSQKLRIIQTYLGQFKNVALVPINQLRSKTNVMYGNPDTTAGGGRALEYYSSIRLSVRRQKMIEKPGIGMPQGVFLKIKVDKNKVSNPFCEAEGIEFLFNSGMNPLSGMIEAGTFTGAIGSNGRGRYWFQQEPDKLFYKKDIQKFLLDGDNYKLVGAPNQEVLEEYISRGQETIDAMASGAYTVVDAPDEDELPMPVKAAARIRPGPPISSDVGADDDN